MYFKQIICSELLSVFALSVILGLNSRLSKSKYLGEKLWNLHFKHRPGVFPSESLRTAV